MMPKLGFCGWYVTHSLHTARKSVALISALEKQKYPHFLDPSTYSSRVLSYSRFHVPVPSVFLICAFSAKYNIKDARFVSLFD
jgi:hypothetical protein